MAPSNLNEFERIIKLFTESLQTINHVFTHNLAAPAPTNNANDVHAGLFADFASQLTHVPQDVQILVDTVRRSLNGGILNDRKYLLERYVQIAASLPSDSPNRAKINDLFIKTLWGNLQHPPLSYLGKIDNRPVLVGEQPANPKPGTIDIRTQEDVWAFRTADGSNNNRFYPHLGQAGSPYARTVCPRTILPSSLPDAGLVFDELFARGEKTREHPNKISSVLFYFATIIIHDCFRTNDVNHDIVDSSSYLDLAPLYGNCRAQQEKIRMMKDGLLKPDCFSEIRLLSFPPGVPALLIAFNRYHNYIATQLKSINEEGRFTLGRGPNAAEVQDENLFQTARLITCGLYINVIINDYIKTILNLNRTNSDWFLDPRVNSDKPGPSQVPEGVGNQVSVEFNLVYRWHSTISKRDEQWTLELFRELLGGKDPSKVSIPELYQVFQKFADVKTPPEQWTFGGLDRDERGVFKDEQLVDLLAQSTEDIAGAFGPRNVPVCMRVIEILGIEQSRQWNVATLNEFRKYFGLMPYQKFDEITTNKQVAMSLEALYGTPDMVELYPGLVAEDVKKTMEPGSGLCAGFTSTAALLADATALVRGDRFYTRDFNGASMTNWGFGQIASNSNVAGGGVIYKLLMRAFPTSYKGNSVYAMFPFVIPDEQRKILRKLDREEDYDYNPPQQAPKVIAINKYEPIIQILGDKQSYSVPWGPNTFYITHHDYMLSGDTAREAEQRKFVQHALMCPMNGMQEIKNTYYTVTRDVFRDNSRKLQAGYLVDIVSQVGNVSHAIAAAKIWHLPVKSKDHPVGPFTPTDLYTLYSLLFAWVFLDGDMANEFLLRFYAKQASVPLKAIVKVVVALVLAEKWTDLNELLGLPRHSKHDPSQGYGVALIKRLAQGGKSVEEVTATVIPTMAAMVATQAQGFAQMMDVLLSEPYRGQHWHKIEQLARSDDPHDFEKLRKYALEAYRLAPAAYGLFRRVEKQTANIQDGDHVVTANYGDTLYVNFVSAGLDERIFPKPLDINIDRDPSLYIHHGYGPHQCLGKDITNFAMTAQLKVCARLKNLRKAPGAQGQMKYTLVNNSIRLYMNPDGSNYSPFPTTMKVMFDDFAADLMPAEQATLLQARL